MRIRLESPASKLAVSLAVFGLLFPYSWLSSSRYKAASLAQLDDRASLERAVIMQPGDADYHEHLARHLLYVDQDASRSSHEYQVAATLNPYDAQSWLGVAQSELILGNESASLEAIHRALSVDPQTPSVAWESGNLLVALNNVDAALGQFRFVIANDPSMLIQGLQLIRRLEASPSKAAELALPPDPATHLVFMNMLIQKGELDGAKQVWKVVTKLHQPVVPSQTFYYFNALIAAKDFDAANEYWKELAAMCPDVARLQVPGNLIRNASFEFPILDGGFDWRYQPSPQVDLQNETLDTHEGHRSLLATFHGQRTSELGMGQFILLDPNTRYRFRGFLKSNLQAANGVRFSLVDLRDQKHLFDTNESVSDLQWKEYSAEFTSGADTRLTVLFVGRSGTSLISGNVLVDDLRLERVER